MWSREEGWGREWYSPSLNINSCASLDAAECSCTQKLIQLVKTSAALLLHALSLLHRAGLRHILAQIFWPSQNFHTTDVNIPRVKVSKLGKTEPGNLFLTPLNVTAEQGISAIFSNHGELVWYNTHRLGEIKVQELDGKSVITVWSGGIILEGLDWGTVSSYDESYALLKKCDVGRKLPNLQPRQISFLYGFSRGADDHRWFTIGYCCQHHHS